MSLTHPLATRIWIFITASVLALPLLIGLPTLTDADLTRQYNRAPTQMPNWSSAAADPPAALQQTVQHLSERMAGVAYLTQTLQRIRFEWFNDPVSPLIARSGDLVFLSTFDPNNRMSGLAASCRTAEGPGPAPWLQQIADNTAFLHRTLHTDAREVGFLIIPSKPVLYHDMLPKGTPASIRSQCQRSATLGELAAWQKEMITKGIPASYPLPLFQARRTDPAFYPMGNFHTEGASAHEAAVSLLKQMYPTRHPWPALDFQYMDRQGDLTHALTFTRMVPHLMPDYGVHTTNIDPDLSSQLQMRHATFRWAQVYRTPTPIIGGNALIIGNSFARHAGPYFAPAFDTTTVLNMGGVPRDALALILTELVDEADVVLFVLQDTAIKGWLWQDERDILEAHEAAN